MFTSGRSFWEAIMKEARVIMIALGKEVRKNGFTIDRGARDG